MTGAVGAASHHDFMDCGPPPWRVQAPSVERIKATEVPAFVIAACTAA